MGSEDINALDGVSCQRIQPGFSSHPGRLMQAGHLSHVYHPPPAGKYRAVGFNDNKGKHFTQKPERDFHNGSTNTFTSMERGMPAVEGEGSRMMVNGSPHVGGVVSTALCVQSWAEIDRTDRMIGEIDYRNIEERGDGSSGSQSDSSDDEDEGDVNINGKANLGEHGPGGSIVELGREGQQSYDVLPHPQIGSLEGRQDPTLGLQGDDEAFQKANYDRERGSQVSTSAAPSLGIFLSPTSYIPFLNSYSSHSTQPTVVQAEANVVRTGSALVPRGLGTSAYYKDGSGKESEISRDSYATDGPNSIHGASRISNVVPVHDAIPLNVVPDCGNYYGAVLQSSGKNFQKDSTEDAGAHSNKKIDERGDLPLRAILSDPVTGLLMDDACILPCGHSFGSNSLQRVIETSVCISCGATIKREYITPNHALRLVVQAFRREDELNLSRSMKRRRDQNRIASTEHVSFESSRGRGVQFPYVINDKVMIKGNKRTPERFVGREAVITNQCLNGWYVVRTLDNGESVKLQYRSLMKLGEHKQCHEVQQKPGPSWL